MGYTVGAPTVAAQQCGLGAAREAAVRLRQSGLFSDAQLADRLDTLSTVTPAEVGGLVERLNIKAGVMEMGERIAWGSDTAIMREAATALAAKDAEMKGWKKTATEYASELYSLRSQLAEARKAMNYLNDAVAVGLSDQEVSRRAKLLFAARREGGE